MDDIPNTTPIGQDRKTLTFKALLQDSNEYVFQRSPFSAWKQGRFFIDLP